MKHTPLKVIEHPVLSKENRSAVFEFGHARVTIESAEGVITNAHALWYLEQARQVLLAGAD